MKLDLCDNRVWLRLNAEEFQFPGFSWAQNYNPDVFTKFWFNFPASQTVANGEMVHEIALILNRRCHLKPFTVADMLNFLEIRKIIFEAIFG